MFAVDGRDRNNNDRAHEGGATFVVFITRSSGWIAPAVRHLQPQLRFGFGDPSEPRLHLGPCLQRILPECAFIEHRPRGIEFALDGEAIIERSERLSQIGASDRDGRATLAALGTSRRQFRTGKDQIRRPQLAELLQATCPDRQSAR